MAEPPVPRGELLLLLDFDGTLVPIAPTPDAIRVPDAVPGLLERLRARGHQVWVITGRPAAWVSERLPGTSVVGLHGLQWPDRPDPPRSPALDRAAEEGEALARRFPGLLVEDKGLSLALHTRQVDPARHAEAAAAARLLAERTAAEDPDLGVLTGHEVVEIRRRDATKAAAVRELSRASGRRVVYVGDDVTDEEAFAALPEGAVSVRVGPPDVPTLAEWRLPDVPAVLAWLERLASA